MLWQLWCHCNPDHDNFLFTVVAIFPNVCLWRRSLCSNLVLTLKNCIEPPSYASTGYVVAIWSSFLFGTFVKIWGTCDNFLGKWSTAPPGKKFPVRLCSRHSLPRGNIVHDFKRRTLDHLLILLWRKNKFNFVPEVDNETYEQCIS